MSERALTVYVGGAERVKFGIGRERGVWGFKSQGEGYENLRPGDWIVFGTWVKGDVRVPEEVWSTYHLDEVVLGRLTTSVYADDTPLWPDQDRELSHPYRCRFDQLACVSDVALSPGKLGPALIEGLHRSALTDRGIVVEADGELITASRATAAFTKGFSDQTLSSQAERSADNVWLEIQDKCRDHMAAGTPILTLDRAVPNSIVAVEEQRIVRQSTEARGEGEPSDVSKASVVRLWERLVRDGEVKNLPVLRFGYALVGRLINGVEFRPDPFRLVLTDRALAMRPWRGAPPPANLSDTALLDMFGALRPSPQPSGSAIHKPLLVLLALSRVQRGEPRLAHFSEYEALLRDLLIEFGPTTPGTPQELPMEFGPPAKDTSTKLPIELGSTTRSTSPELPFCRLQNDGVWEVVDANGNRLFSAGPSLADLPMATLRHPATLGGFTEEVFRLLSTDRLLVVAVAQLILEQSFPDSQDAVAVKCGLAMPEEEAIGYHDYALQRLARALGDEPFQVGTDRTYRLGRGRKIHVRTMARTKLDHWYWYPFGMEEVLWQAGDFFVLQCGLSGTMVVPIVDWLPMQANMPLLHSGTESAQRQPAIWRQGRTFELGVGGTPHVVSEQARIDARRWLDRWDLLIGGGDPSVWWVNQGQNYGSERDGGYLWAPKKTRSGAVLAMHSAVARLQPGDITVHYAQGAIRAVGRVTEPAVDLPRPGSALGQESQDGFLATVIYYELAEPIALNAIPESDRVREKGPFNASGGIKQGYLFPLSAAFSDLLRRLFPSRWPEGSALAEPAVDEGYVEPTFANIESVIAGAGLRIDPQTLRRYHVSLRAGGFVILSGLSGTGKTWLAEAYARAAGAEYLVVPVAPNWTTNEDLLGYYNPLDSTYHDTPFSRFVREAAKTYASAQAQNAVPRPFHLVLDEMNLARVEYYFAKFLSAMETRSRQKTAAMELAPGEEVLLTPNLYFIGTVNIDETTHGFADKVYDRAQLVELTVSRELVIEHIGNVPWATTLLSIWDGLVDVAPFAFRVIDQIKAYITDAKRLEVSWEAALDEQLLQKVLPKVRGVDPRVGEALQRLIDACGKSQPLAAAKATQMLEAFKQHGFASYF